MMLNPLDLIGKTPLVRLSGYIEKNKLGAGLYAKLEWFSLTGSVKDRIALSMINAAEKAGKINKDTLIIEPTSGNTGIGIAAVCAIKGYKAVIVMPSSMSIERRKLMQAYGADVILTPAAEGMKGAIAKADELAKKNPDSIILGQFSNMNNPAAHFSATGPEIWEDTKGEVAAFVAGAGTGGTLTGVGRYFKLQKPDVKIIAVEPAESAVISGKAPGPHGIQGIGAGFIPENLKTDILDEVIKVPTADAIKAARILPKTDGLMIGISSGAALCAATMVAARPEMRGKKVVVLFADNADKYMSTALFDDSIN